jgi:hypothetical protein
MFNFCLLGALCNMLGGRFEDVWGEKFPIRGALLFRCIIPGMAAAAFAHSIGRDWTLTAYVWFAVTTGSAFWFPFRWTFEEITGVPESKYPMWIRKIGLYLFSLDGLAKTNIRRGILMKGIRGAYDIFTFALLSVINPYAMVFWLGTFLMGVFYWATAKLTPGARQDVLASEFTYGAWRFLMIGLAITTGAINWWV